MRPIVRQFYGSLLAGTCVLIVVVQAGAQGSFYLSPVSGKPAKSLLLPGTVLYVRLETPVSTRSSHLHAPLVARVVREISASHDVVIPLGTVVRGRIETLVPSSSPTDRARLRLRFNRLEVPGQSPLEIASHVIEVENAREKVLPNGTVQGVLASELPLGQLERAVEKLGKTDPQAAETAKKTQEKILGKSSTAIEYPAGADLQLALDKPVELHEAFDPAVSGRLSAEVRERVERESLEAPRRTQDKNGNPGDPINLVFVGSERDIRQAFERAGWIEPEKSNSKSVWESIRALIGDQGYQKAPVSDLLFYDRRQDLAFAKMLNTVAKRHHLRLWRSPSKTHDEREVWLAAATHDSGFDVRPGIVSHAIDPNLDLEREKVGADLELTGQVVAEELMIRQNPVTEGWTATGAPWKTDGRLLVIELKGDWH